MTARMRATIAAATLTVCLAACSRSADEAPPPDNGVEASPEPTATVAPTSPDPQPSPSETPAANLAAEIPPAVAPPPDEQMTDDATATGMTARVSRDEAPANDAVPVEQK